MATLPGYGAEMTEHNYAHTEWCCFDKYNHVNRTNTGKSPLCSIFVCEFYAIQNKLFLYYDYYDDDDDVYYYITVDLYIALDTIFYIFNRCFCQFYTNCYILYQNSIHVLDQDSVANLFTFITTTSQFRCQMTCHKQAV